MTTSNAKHVDALERRAGWLQQKIDAAAGSPGSLGYTEGELAALRWAVPILRDLVEQIRADARDVHKQRRFDEYRNIGVRALVHLLDLDKRDAVDDVLFRVSTDVRTDLMHRIEHWFDQRRFGTSIPPADDTRPRFAIFTPEEAAAEIEHEAEEAEKQFRHDGYVDAAEDEIFNR